MKAGRRASVAGRLKMREEMVIFAPQHSMKEYDDGSLSVSGMIVRTIDGVFPSITTIPSLNSIPTFSD